MLYHGRARQHAELDVEVETEPLAAGRHNLYVKVVTCELGPLEVDVYERI